MAESEADAAGPLEPGAAAEQQARRVAEAKATVPHLYLEAEARPPGPVSTAALVGAVARALSDVPAVNGAYRDGRYELRSEVNVAVAVPAQGTVLFPTVRDADRKDEDALAAEVDELSERARSGELTRPQASGATFTLADLREEGIARASGIVRRGQAAFLSVGEPSPGALSLSLACDARILHGPEAGAFLRRVRDLLGQTSA